MRQENKSFTEYFVEFRKLLLEAGGDQWPDEVKKRYLEAGLNKELQRNMIGRTRPGQPFESYYEELKLVSDQVEAFRLRNRSSLPAYGQPANQRGLHQSRQPRTEEASQQSSPAAQPGNPDRMDWEPSGKRAKWVSKDEISRRRQQGLCIRCGASGHIQRNCPHDPPRRPETQSTKRVAKGKLEAPALLEEDEEEVPSSSEN